MDFLFIIKRKKTHNFRFVFPENNIFFLRTKQTIKFPPFGFPPTRNTEHARFQSSNGVKNDLGGVESTCSHAAAIGRVGGGG